MTETWFTRAVDFWHEWAIRVAASSSLVAHVVLALLAGSRRRNWCPGWRLVLWVAYQIVDIAGTYALSNLSIDTTGDKAAVEREQLLVAFWTPFLLLHMGGPDNIGAYSLEDDKLSLRKVFGTVSQVLGALYVVYTNIYLGDSWLLRAATIIMITVGIPRFFEKALALLGGDFGKIRGSSNKKHPSPAVLFSIGEQELDNEHALLCAQIMFLYCGRRTMADSSDEKHNLEVSRKILSLGWKDMCKVVELEASLIYDVLYTKAAKVHTWGGYLLRLISPLATATAAFLFWLYPKVSVEPVDVIITYILLVAAFMLDVVWLVTALGSTWAYAFLTARPRVWLHHKVLCGGWWCWFRHIAVSLHPWRLLGKDPSSYRMWSGAIGRYDLLYECTRAPGCTASLCSWLATKVGQEDTWNECRFWKYLSEIPQDVKELLFERIKRRLSDTTDGNATAYPRKDIRALWGQEAVKRCKKKFGGLKLPSFGREFQEDILLWHIATTIYLWSGNHQLIRGANASTMQRNHVKAIEAVSEYLMFLLAARPHMLPDCALRRLYEVTCQVLEEEWVKGKENSSCCASRKKKFAEILCNKEESGDPDSDPNRRLISEATRLAIALQQVDSMKVKDLVELIFDVWVDKLLYAGIQCSRESHAKQLSRGGELITIVWIVAEHAGLFCIGEPYNEIIDDGSSPDCSPTNPRVRTGSGTERVCVCVCAGVCVCALRARSQAASLGGTGCPLSWPIS
ncbi:uncharacterized protein LOC133886527 [Phragmites australis]|uniref:uncharacterized protein LOC133886527 n=1 Tax=Phragmites australis TaxID=29695 RepID=UPI002D78C500|nr:uncharacterized protein LOC133886527 [Phragmites australis]